MAAYLLQAVATGPLQLDLVAETQHMQ